MGTQKQGDNGRVERHDRWWDSVRSMKGARKTHVSADRIREERKGRYERGSGMVCV